MSKTPTVKQDEEPQGKPTRCQHVSGFPFTAHNCFLISCAAPLKRKLLQTIEKQRKALFLDGCAHSRLMWQPRVHGGSETWAFRGNGSKHYWESQSHIGKQKKMEEKLFLLGRRLLFIVVRWKSFTHSDSFVLVISKGKKKQKRVNFACDVMLRKWH